MALNGQTFKKQKRGKKEEELVLVLAYRSENPNFEEKKKKKAGGCECTVSTWKCTTGTIQAWLQHSGPSEVQFAIF